MRIFLVDFENVHSDGISGVDSLVETDEVVIFYSNNADSITFEMMHKLMFSKAKLSYYKVRRGGRNALDFQMSSYLGYLINALSGNNSKKSKVEFFLISKDSGFDFVIDFWESGNANIKPIVKRFYNIKAVLGQDKSKQIDTDVVDKAPTATSVETLVIVESPASAATPVDIVTSTTQAVIVESPASTMETPAEMDLETTAEVDKLLLESKSSHELYISTVKRFGQKKGVEIYRNIKSRFFTQKTG